MERGWWEPMVSIAPRGHAARRTRVLAALWILLSSAKPRGHLALTLRRCFPSVPGSPQRSSSLARKVAESNKTSNKLLPGDQPHSSRREGQRPRVGKDPSFSNCR